MKLASNQLELDATLCLRFEVFNLDLNEDLDSSYLTMRNEIHVPPLLAMSLRYGAKVIGKPVIDCELKTIDCFVLLDTCKMPLSQYEMFIA